MSWLYRLCLAAYPEPLRSSFGRDMEELFADLRREERRRRGRAAALSVIVRTLAELPFSAVQARRMESERPASGAAAAGIRQAARDRRPGGAPRGGVPAPPSRRSRRGPGGVDTVLQNLRHALRSLRRSPGFAVVVVLTLAIGIGANTVMFTVLDGILLSPLPYGNPDRLIRLYSAGLDNPDRREFVPGAAFLAYREQTDLFENLASLYTYREQGADLTHDGDTRRITIMPISSGLFETLGVEPALGREFSLEEETGDSMVAVISHALWQSAFAGAPDVLGKQIDLQGFPHTVVGVMPAGFRNPVGGAVDLWRPENLQPGGRNNWDNHYLSVVGRLRPGVSIEQAHAKLDALNPSFAEEDPDAEGNLARLYPLLEDTVGRTRPMLWVLMGAVGMVLLIACVNVASLFLARSADRWKELAIRAALGAGRRNLIGQMLSESLLLGIAGGLAGLLLSYAGLAAIIASSPENLPRVSELGIDFRVFAFAAIISMLTGLLFGIAPALQFSRPHLERTLRQEDRGNSGGNANRRLRGALVVAEVSIALVLLFGAGLLTKSFGRLIEVDLGIRSGGVLTYEVHLPGSRYAEAAERVAFYDRFFEKVRSIAGVEGVGATSYLPGEGRYHQWGLGRVDMDLEADEAWAGPDVRVIDGEYLDLMGIDLVRGRTFASTDTIDSQPVLLINETLAETHFADRDPIGAPVRVGGQPWVVAGVVTDTAYDPLGSVSPKVYLPHDQFADDRNWAMIQTVRTAGEPTAIVGQLRGELARIDPQLVLYRVRPMNEVIGSAVAPHKFSMALMMGFAATAMLLAAIGVYGVLSYTVAQRTREIGIRMALGADRSWVSGFIMRQGLALTGIGVSIGIAAALLLSRWLSSMLFEVQPHDPIVLGAVILVLGAVATLAGYLPARRATSVDPMLALRKQ